MVTPHFELEIRPASDFSQLAGFCCGLEEMDNFIHSRLATCDQIHFVNTYFVFHEEEVIALFSLSTGSVILDSDDFEDIQMGARNRMHSLEFTTDEDFLENYFYVHRTYPTIELQYLAVREDYRSKQDSSSEKLHVGKVIIDAIVAKAKSLDLGAMFISVDAYDTDEYSAVPFYEKCGFGVVDVVRKNDIRRMIKTIWEEE